MACSPPDPCRLVRQVKQFGAGAVLYPRPLPACPAGEEVRRLTAAWLNSFTCRTSRQGSGRTRGSLS